MTALRQRILLALGAPVVALGCPREPVMGAGTDASLEVSSAGSASTDPVAPPLVLDGAAEETSQADTALVAADTSVVDVASVDAKPVAKPVAKPAAVTYVQYKPPQTPPNYCPQTWTAQCMPLADALSIGSFSGAGSTGKACPAKIVAACPCSPASPMGCQAGAECFDAYLPAVTLTEAKKSKVPVCCYTTQEVCVPPWVGRALRRAREDVIADVAPRDDWTKGSSHRGSGSTRFLRAALGEHAAIASFSLTALALLAHGAPAELVADTHRAALDEVEHARLMFGLAGPGLGPGALALPPLRIPTAVELVTSTFRDACVQETIGAVAVRAEAEEEADPTVRAALETIAADEERHAILAYRTLAWALSVSGEAGRAALRSELAALDSTTPLIAELVVPCAEAALSAGALASLS